MKRSVGTTQPLFHKVVPIRYSFSESDRYSGLGGATNEEFRENKRESDRVTLVRVAIYHMREMRLEAKYGRDGIPRRETIFGPVTIKEIEEAEDFLEANPDFADSEKDRERKAKRREYDRDRRAS